MHGNVWEWCEDESAPGSGPRVLRGGGWGNYAGGCRSAARDRFPPDYRPDYGFRPIRPSP